MKGIIVFYINFFPDLGQDVEVVVNQFKNINKDLLDKIKQENFYETMIVPTTRESSRVEKVDFDKPHPRYSPFTHKNIDPESSEEKND